MMKGINRKLEMGELINLFNESIFNKTLRRHEGLNILASIEKDREVIHSLGHQIVYCNSIQDVVKSGITKEEANKLIDCGFRIDTEDTGRFCFYTWKE